MPKGKLAAVGDAESMLALRAAGMQTVAAETPDTVEEAVHRLAREGYAVIFITETAAQSVPEVLRYYKSRTYPVLLPVPSRTGPTGFGMQGIRDNMEKAIGSNLLDNGNAKG